MESRWSKGSPSKLNTNIIDIYIFQNVVLIIVLKFIIMFSYFIYIVLKLKNKYSFFLLLFILNPLCRRTIRQFYPSFQKYLKNMLPLISIFIFLNINYFMNHNLDSDVSIHATRLLQISLIGG